MSEQQQIIELWKQHNLTEARFVYNCGGDSMGDTEWEFSNAKGDCDAPKEIEDYLNEIVYNRVDFYVDSDGYYQGEAGTVTVTLDEDNEEAPDFCFSKDCQYEYSESYEEVVEVPLTPEEADFIRKYVENINGGMDAAFTLNYKDDCLLTDEEEEIREGLDESIGQYLDDVEPKGHYEGERNDWYEYNTDIDGEEGEPMLVGDTLLVQKRFSITVYKDN